MPSPSKKQAALEKVFQATLARGGPLVFDNKLVKQLTGEDFSNQFDVTKQDTSEKLPTLLRNQDFFVVHLGGGKHQFVKGIKLGYHELEPISDSETIPWKYRKSILNEMDSSEANILSLISNQRIVHDFLYEDIIASAKVYLRKRKKSSFSYAVGQQTIEATTVQVETALTFEYLGHVTICEAKNGMPKDFAVYQLFHPIRYYLNLQRQHRLAITKISGMFVNRHVANSQTLVELRLYEFTNPDDIGSINLVKKSRYRLDRG
ncbi:MAG: hypothetical protein V1724_04745 [Chloroflexota bacterium]